MEITQFSKNVRSYFTESAESEAVNSIRQYLKPGAFTGSSFEKIHVADQFTITAEDIVAVSMLSVKIPARCSEWILGDGDPIIRHLLEMIPVDADIKSFESLNDRGGPAWELWNLLIEFPNMGRTKTSKLLARKRSNLFPIYDSVVGNALGIKRSDNDWLLWQGFMNKSGVGNFREAANKAGAQHLSDLRVIDIVIWMKEQGWKYVAPDEKSLET